MAIFALPFVAAFRLARITAFCGGMFGFYLALRFWGIA